MSQTLPIFSTKLFQFRVSSVLNKEAQTCGKQFMFDGEEETCWCSDQGTPQWIAIMFHQPVRLKGLNIQFQGGFVGKECQAVINSGETESVVNFYPEDKNSLQTFNINSTECEKVKINFSTSTDFFGRIVIYKLELFGDIV